MSFNLASSSESSDNKHEDLDERARVAAAEKLAAYWDRFPQSGAHLTQKQKIKILHEADIPTLQQEFQLAASTNSKVNIERLVHKAFLMLGSYLEYAVVYMWPHMSYVQGTIRDLVYKGEVDVELAEIAIDLQPFFNYGPYSRLIIKVITAMMAREVISAFTSQTVDNIRGGRLNADPTKHTDLEDKYSRM